MTLLYLVRHGRAAAGWNTEPDPGLDDLGRRQAVQIATRLGPLGPLAVVTSTMRRCQETAVPLCTAWATAARIEPLVAEIPSPHGVAMVDRVEWLRTAMAGGWSELAERYTAFRDGVVGALLGCPTDTVVFSHFVAINAAIGVATGDDRLVIRSLDNCSVTIIEAVAGVLHLREGGHEADTLIR
jgi:broad specificity phosphatase PhoE